MTMPPRSTAYRVFLFTRWGGDRGRVKLSGSAEDDLLISAFFGIPFVVDRVAVFAGYGSQFDAKISEHRVILNLRDLGRLSTHLARLKVFWLAWLGLQLCNSSFKGFDAMRHFFQRFPYRCFFEDFKHV